jgi:hypothetical protein
MGIPRGRTQAQSLPKRDTCEPMQGDEPHGRKSITRAHEAESEDALQRWETEGGAVGWGVEQSISVP